MKIPFIDYEFTVPRKVIFCALSMVIYLLVAMPDINKIVGKIFDLHDYDDKTKPDRYYLLLIHTVVFGFLMFILLMLYNPNPSHISHSLNHQTSHISAQAPKSLVHKS